MSHPRLGSLPCKNRRNIIYAPVAELADAYGSGPYEGNFMEVQVLSGAPKFIPHKSHDIAVAGDSVFRAVLSLL